MAKFWFLRITAGRATIDDVPARWRDAVQAMLDADAAETESRAEEDA